MIFVVGMINSIFKISRSEYVIGDRIIYSNVDGATDLFTPEFIKYLVELHDRFKPQIRALRAKRADVLTKALNGQPLKPLTVTKIIPGSGRELKYPDPPP